jgi:hypothetical protein
VYPAQRKKAIQHTGGPPDRAKAFTFFRSYGHIFLPPEIAAQFPVVKKPGFSGLRCRSGPAGALRAPYNPLCGAATQKPARQLRTATRMSMRLPGHAKLRPARDAWPIGAVGGVSGFLLRLNSYNL